MWKDGVVFIGFLSLAGCGTLGTVKFDNPVMGPAPPREALAEPANRQTAVRNDLTPRQFTEDKLQGVIPASDVQPQPTTGDRLDGSQIVATVNGTLIFDSEVLERYGLQLEQARQQVSPEEFQKLRNQLIKQDLQGHIDRKLLVHSLRSSLKKEQLVMLDAHLGGLFDQEVKRMQEGLKVNTRQELEAELQKQGTSLENLRVSFINQRMAMEYLASRSKDIPEVGRPDMLRYYDEHAEDYFVAGQVKWQQIVINFEKQGGQRAALEKLDELIDALRDKQDFGDVARKYSDGVTAEQGGHWDWIHRNSLADKRAEKALFELPVGTISQVFASKKDYQLVKAVARREPRQIPFKKVQSEIKDKLKKEARSETTRKVLEELLTNATINTIFD
jgi:parvulin-like peptidyl-prolyl isomerase